MTDNAACLAMHRADRAEITRLLDEAEQLRAELAELRAKIAEVEWLCNEHAYDIGGGVGHLVSRDEIRRILASSGSAPTGQEER